MNEICGLSKHVSLMDALTTINASHPSRCQDAIGMVTQSDILNADVMDVDSEKGNIQWPSSCEVMRMILMDAMMIRWERIVTRCITAVASTREQRKTWSTSHEHV